MKNMLMHVHQKVESDDKVKEIDPLVLICHGCKKYRKKILQEPLDDRFYRCSKRINTHFQNPDIQDTSEATSSEIHGLPPSELTSIYV
jgi:hypothetical protein